MRILRIVSALSLWLGAQQLQAQTGPFDPGNWPTTADPGKVVHFVTTDGSLTPLSDSWLGTSMRILSGGDQQTASFTIGGVTGVKVLGSYFNVADKSYATWADYDTIDILMEVYGDDAILNPDGTPRNFNFLTGILPELAAPRGGSLPPEAKNRKWNWVLFRIPNGTRPSDGSRLIGTIPANAQGDFSAGGVNGGTIRLESVPNLIVRTVAWGERGAFGEPEVINLFAPEDVCDPEPNTNLASINFATGETNHLSVLNFGDQTVTAAEGIGPDGDKRAAVLPVGAYLNFGITDNYLGKACNTPRTVKICLDYYDDPALVGATIGPEAYTTDETGSIAFVPSADRQVLAGSGVWVRRSWVIPAVSLFGVNAAPLTAGPRLAIDKGPVAISRFEIAVLRVGTHPLAGQDPLADCFQDPNICTDAYGSVVEMDLGNGVFSGLTPGSSGGDQQMIQAEAGPESDRRMAIRPAREDGSPGFAHEYLNFAIVNQALGPSSQPNARLAICVTYYDDPALIGASFRPEVYMTEKNGTVTFGFTPGSIAVKLEGTDRWREAYFEIPDVKFLGVNQGPQAAARFQLSNKIFFTRVQYAVIRPCGPKADFNALEECKGPRLRITHLPDGQIRIAWKKPAVDSHLEATETIDAASSWTPVAENPSEDGEDLVVVTPGTATRYFRLRQ